MFHIPYQLLRQLLDDKVLCTLQKPFEWKTVEGLNVISAMSMSEYQSVNNQMLSSRLLVKICTLYKIQLAAVQQKTK